MDAITFVRHSLQQGRERLLGSLRDLPPELLPWRPTPHGNSIGWLLLHIGLAEDAHTHRFMGRDPLIWARDKWYERFGVPNIGRAVELTEEQRHHIEGLGLEMILEYAEAVRRETYAYLATLRPGDLERVPVREDPDLTVGAMFRHTINHEAQHGGQIDYIRGLHQSGWDLGRGFGMVQR